MSQDHLDLYELNEELKNGYPNKGDKIWSKIPFAETLEKVWDNNKHYQTHAPKVIKSMNHLLSDTPDKILARKLSKTRKINFNDEILRIRENIFGSWEKSRLNGFLRTAALYHDIGKYIIRERHPIIGWHIIEYMNIEEKEKLKKLLEDDDTFRLFMIVIRDHDLFGTLSTGEASYPILLKTVDSAGDDIIEQKEALTALLLCNFSDIAGTIDLDINTVDILIKDWWFFIKAIDNNQNNPLPLNENILRKASEIKFVLERIRRILLTSSVRNRKRYEELNNPRFLNDCLRTVFGSDKALREFSFQFTHVCKLDYGKRFFDGLFEYCEGPPENDKSKTMRSLPSWHKEYVETKKVVYSVLAVLKRICTAYAAMIGATQNPGNLIGIELKDLTPDNAPEKTAQIINLLVSSHYPALNWMMSDVPAWYL